MHEFLNYFNKLEETRNGNAMRHSLSNIMAIAFLASLCGAETAVDMANFGKSKEELLGEFLDLPHGTPSHDTFSRVFQSIDKAKFAAVFAEFTKDFRHRIKALSGNEAIAIDGKTLRGSFDRAGKQSALNMVTAWGHEVGLSFACTVAGQAGGEIVALRQLLEILDIKGQWVTADALHCQRETAKQIVEQGGKYCLTCKENQGTLHNDLRLFVNDPETEIADIFESVDKDHDRLETRVVKVYTDLDWLRETHDWPGLKAVATVKATRDDSPANTRLFLLSEVIDAETAARLIRGHWGIENGLHWTLDVIMREDAHRARKENAPANFGILRRAALNVIKADTSKASNRAKFKIAGWDDRFLRSLIAQI